jgi:protein-tyrosine phosphatase
VRDRALVWDGCVNVRDLGGHPTEDGGTTRFGVVVRSDNVRRLSEEGWQQLVEYGVTRIVDLRFPGESTEDAPREVDIDVVHVPLLEDQTRVDEIDDLVRHITEPAPWRCAVYLEFLDRFAANFAAAVTGVAEMSEGAVLVHCAGGVDRTGLVAALLLRIAGVGIAPVAEDYAASEANWAPFTDEWLDEAETEQERLKRQLLSVMPADAMRDVLEELEHRHGDAWSYLEASGVRAEDLQRIRGRLRT